MTWLKSEKRKIFSLTKKKFYRIGYRLKLYLISRFWPLSSCRRNKVCRHRWMSVPIRAVNYQTSMRHLDDRLRRYVTELLWRDDAQGQLEVTPDVPIAYEVFADSCARVTQFLWSVAWDRHTFESARREWQTSREPRPSEFQAPRHQGHLLPRTPWTPIWWH